MAGVMLNAANRRMDRGRSYSTAPKRELKFLCFSAQFTKLGWMLVGLPVLLAMSWVWAYAVWGFGLIIEKAEITIFQIYRFLARSPARTLTGSFPSLALISSLGNN